MTGSPPPLEAQRAAVPHPWAFATVAAMLATMLVFHFVCTTLSVFPPNPLSAPINPAVNRYLAPYFVQSWRLFAPDPGGPSLVLLVQCRSDDGTSTPWIDVTTPMYESTRANRLHPAQALHRLDKGAMANMLGIRDAFTEHLEEKLAAEPDNDALREVVDTAPKAQQISVEQRARPLMRLASAYCGGLVEPTRLTEVRVRIDTFEIPPFSRRREPIDISQVQTYEYPWVAAERVPPL